MFYVGKNGQLRVGQYGPQQLRLRQRSNLVARNIVARKHIAEVVYEGCWQHFALTLFSVENFPINRSEFIFYHSLVE